MNEWILSLKKAKVRDVILFSVAVGSGTLSHAGEVREQDINADVYDFCAARAAPYYRERGEESGKDIEENCLATFSQHEDEGQAKIAGCYNSTIGLTESGLQELSEIQFSNRLVEEADRHINCLKDELSHYLSEKEMTGLSESLARISGIASTHLYDGQMSRYLSRGYEINVLESLLIDLSRGHF